MPLLHARIKRLLPLRQDYLEKQRCNSEEISTTIECLKRRQLTELLNREDMASIYQMAETDEEMETDEEFDDQM